MNPPLGHTTLLLSWDVGRKAIMFSSAITRLGGQQNGEQENIIRCYQTTALLGLDSLNRALALLPLSN